MKNRLINITLALVTVSFTLGLSEVLLRLTNLVPVVSDISPSNEPEIQTSDAILGWKNKTGDYQYPPYSSAVNDDIRVNFDENGFRKTSANDYSKNSHKILFAGGSFIQGLGISNHETVAWKVQQAFPEFEVVNCGVPGYGTYQTLLSLEQYLPKVDSAKFVFYGLINHHLERNVATPFWTELLSSIKNRSQIPLPFVSLINDQLERHPPEEYHRIPFSSNLLLIKLIERSIFNYRPNISRADQKRILILLLEEMKQVVEANGAKLVVVGLSLRDSNLELLAENNFTVLDCQWDTKDSSYEVQGDGHPNGKANSEWAEKVIKYLKAD